MEEREHKGWLRQMTGQGILLSLLIHQGLILGLANYGAPVEPYRLQRQVSQLEEFQVQETPKTMRLPDVGRTPPTLVTAPEPSILESAQDTFIPNVEYVPLEFKPDNPWDFVKPPVGPVDPTMVGLVPPKQISAPRPEYPAFLREAGWEGECVVGMQLDEQGAVVKVWLIRTSGKTEADEASLEAARGSSWEPARQNGVAFPKQVAVTYAFELDTVR